MLQANPPSTIWLHADAPPKPPHGSACNGCGVCCAAAPCPLGIGLTRSRTGRCAALVWDDAASCYRCGALTEPTRWLPRLPGAAALARRWIAAGRGCDCDYQAAPG